MKNTAVGGGGGESDSTARGQARRCSTEAHPCTSTFASEGQRRGGARTAGCVYSCALHTFLYSVSCVSKGAAASTSVLRTPRMQQPLACHTLCAGRTSGTLWSPGSKRERSCARRFSLEGPRMDPTRAVRLRNTYGCTTIAWLNKLARQNCAIYSGLI
jgi:hypothetical protein